MARDKFPDFHLTVTRLASQWHAAKARVFEAELHLRESQRQLALLGFTAPLSDYELTTALTNEAFRCEVEGCDCPVWGADWRDGKSVQKTRCKEHGP